jgi:hypothetical protein
MTCLGRAAVTGTCLGGSEAGGRIAWIELSHGGCCTATKVRRAAACIRHSAQHGTAYACTESIRWRRALPSL